MQSFCFDTVDSTNEAAKRMIRSGEIRESAYLLAREQTAGKGTRGRGWVSLKDAGIYLSVVEIPPPTVVASADATNFTLAAGVACVEAIAETAGVTVMLKPVNDLYVNGAKLGGILTEAVILNGSVEAVITGVGVNMRKMERGLSANAPTPVSLEECLSVEQFARLDWNVVVAALVLKIRKWNSVVMAGRFSQVAGELERHSIPGAVAHATDTPFPIRT